MGLYAPDALIALFRKVQRSDQFDVRTDGLPPSAFIAAAKNGYHDSVSGNPSSDYSVQAPADRRGDKNAARAVDISLPPAQMKVFTRRMVDACKENDPRVECVREVIGTLDGDRVLTFNRYASGSGSRSKTGVLMDVSDDTHLWHGHTSIFTEDATDMGKMLALADVMLGIPLKVNPGPVPPPPKEWSDMASEQEIEDAAYRGTLRAMEAVGGKYALRAVDRRVKDTVKVPGSDDKVWFSTALGLILDAVMKDKHIDRVHLDEWRAAEAEDEESK